MGHTKYSKQQKWPKRQEQSASKDQSSGATKDFLSRTRSGIQNLMIYPADKVLKRCRTGQMSLKEERQMCWESSTKRILLVLARRCWAMCTMQPLPDPTWTATCRRDLRLLTPVLCWGDVWWRSSLQQGLLQGAGQCLWVAELTLGPHCFSIHPFFTLNTYLCCSTSLLINSSCNPM